MSDTRMPTRSSRSESFTHETMVSIMPVGNMATVSQNTINTDCGNCLVIS